jgi:hypothetical protein
MATQQTAHRFKVGDRVKIWHSDWSARIVECRGPLGPGGKLIYRVRVPHKPKPIYIEVSEDQLVLISSSPEMGLSPVPAPPLLDPPSVPGTYAPVPRPPRVKSNKRPKRQ